MPRKRKQESPFQTLVDGLNLHGLSEGEFSCASVHPALLKVIDDLPGPEEPDGDEAWKEMLTPLQQQLRECITTEGLIIIIREYPILLIMPGMLESIMIHFQIAISLAWLAPERVAAILAEGNDG